MSKIKADISYMEILKITDFKNDIARNYWKRAGNDAREFDVVFKNHKRPLHFTLIGGVFSTFFETNELDGNISSK